MLEPHWPQHDSPIICVNAQQYLSIPSTHSAFTPHRDKIHIFKKCLVSPLLLFRLHLKSSHLKQHKVGSAVLDYKVPHLCVNASILLQYTAQSLCNHINIRVTTFILLQCIDTVFVESHKHTICVITFILCQCTDTVFVQSYKHTIHVTTFILLQCTQCLYNHTNILSVLLNSYYFSV